MADARGPARLPEPLADRGYFDDFVDHFGLRDAITFRTEVTKVAQADGGGWDVTIRPRDDAGDVETRHYDHVLVANGHHWDPRWPEPSFPGSETFPGEQIHAHYYRTPEPSRAGRVVVLGIGNSATDIAVEASRRRSGDVPRDAPRRLDPAEVPVRHARPTT